MNNELPALDTSEYRAWIGALKKRYRATQIKAAVAVNSALIERAREFPAQRWLIRDSA